MRSRVGLICLSFILGLLATTARAQQFCHETTGGCFQMPPVGLACNGTITWMPCPATSPTPTPTRTPTPNPAAATPTPGVTASVKLTKITFPVSSFIYAPECIVVAGEKPYVCTPTVGDRIRLYSSKDKLTWADEGPILTALCGTWEDDGNTHSGAVDYCTGISNFVLTRSRTSGKWWAAYVAGRAPNNVGAGGIGLAWANDYRGPWTRYAGNPILSEKDGFAGVARLFRVSVALAQSGTRGLKAVQPFAWLFISDQAGRLYRQPIDDMTGSVTGTLFELSAALQGYSPIGWDWNGCWGIKGLEWSDATAFGSVQVYQRGDCATTAGELVATIKASDLGHKGIAGVAMIERSPEGGMLGGPTLLITPWDTWASITVPVAVQIGTPVSTVLSIDPAALWAITPR